MSARYKQQKLVTGEKMKELKDVRLDLNNYISAYYDRNRSCLEDYEFATVSGAMWKGSYSEQFKNKPKPEINKIYGSINRILGQKQRMEMNAKIISNSDEATDEGADLLQSRWRNDFQASDGNEALNNSDQEAFFSGFGAYKLVAKYEDEENPDSEKQYLCVEPIYSAASSVVFSPSVRKDKADSKQAWHIIRTSRKEVEEEFNTDVNSINAQIDWFDWDTDSEKDIYLAHYYEVIEKKITEYDFGGGYIITTGDGIKDSYGNKITRDDLNEIRDIREHKTTRRKVKYVEYALMSGDKFLTKPVKLPFKRVPVIPQYGYYQVINGIEYYCGEVRKRRDPQMFLNTYHSALMEIMAAPQVEKPEYTPEQIAKHAGQRSQADVDNAAFVMSDPILNTDGSIAHVGPIGTQKPPQVGTGLMAAGQQLGSDLLDMAGTGQTTLPSNASGDAVQQVNDRNDDAFQPLMQNSIAAIKTACEVWIDAAQKLYFSNQRSLRVQAVDGSYSQVTTLEYDTDDNGVYGPFKNNAKGRYTAQVKVGESYKSKKEAELETTLKMLQFADTNTPQGQMLLNQAIVSTTGEGGERSRKVANYQIMDSMIALGLDPEPKTEEEKQYVEQKVTQMQQAAQNQQPDAAMVMAQAEMLKGQADMLEQQNRQAEIQLQAGKVQADAQGKQVKQMSDDQYNFIKAQQDQQKIDNKAFDDQQKNAIKLTEVEVNAGLELNKQVSQNVAATNG
jgi:hypothetical protein